MAWRIRGIHPESDCEWVEASGFGTMREAEEHLRSNQCGSEPVDWVVEEEPEAPKPTKEAQEINAWRESIRTHIASCPVCERAQGWTPDYCPTGKSLVGDGVISSQTAMRE